jgi:hypothetical protein
MSGRRDAPERDAHPVLHRAWAEARSVALAWRQHYLLPPNDPRFLDATEEEMVEDLLAIGYREVQRRAPAEAAEKENASDDNLESLKQLRTELEEGRLGDLLRRSLVPPAPPKRITSITVRGTIR